ncbi:MAG: fibronectin type III domain-containing protein, partial [Jatrophihabitans sp.]|uniref:fibronectin type III domain-containing protein n=1 Tax=Jatrophihabitans sp. TaxID=1932789 RepID=UPI003F81BA05
LVAAAALTVVAPAASAATGSPWGTLAPVSWRLGSLQLHGYAIDPDTTAPIRVAVTVDGRVAGAVTAGNWLGWLTGPYRAYGGHHGYATSVNVPDGQHTVCTVARNVRAGRDTTLRCVTVSGRNDPVGRLTAAHTAAGIVVSGWALDPNVTAPVQLRPTLDGMPVTPQTAAAPATGLPAWWSANGSAHAYSFTVPTDRFAHRVCVTVVNVGPGVDTLLGCRSLAPYVTVPDAPQQLQVTNTGTGTITAGWAAPDFDGGAPVTGYRVSIDDTAPQTVPVTPTAFTVVNLLPNTAHTISVAAVNSIGAGPATTVQGTTAAALAAAPQALTAKATATSVTLTWQAPSSTGGVPVTGYVLTSPGRSPVSLAATTRSTTIGSLACSTTYAVTLAATNVVGTGASATTNVTTATCIPPQTTPAPVSTSHYLRALTGVASHDVPALRAMGATDAGYNPSGHRYLVLQDIGAQANGGVILSATTKWISYASLVSALEAYVDGYASTQKVSAPMLLAIGTNNDGMVSSAQGAIWADQVVDPVRAYAAKYTNITVAGADDIEPGFSATVSASRAWLTGYLGATTAQFVFNGSADGCPTSSGTVCNNGWHTTDLNWLSGGAAPTRILGLPQIYNTAMPKQWHVISAAAQRIAFAGPLTEWTACDQAGGCSSASNVNAWQWLFSAINADPRTAQSSMSYGTDLQIN